MSSIVDENKKNNICYVCKDESKKAKLCKCKKIKYCSKECQLKDRSRHVKDDKCFFVKEKQNKIKNNNFNDLENKAKEMYGNEDFNFEKVKIDLFDIIKFIKDKDDITWDFIFTKMYQIYLKNKGDNYEEIFNKVLKLDNKIFNKIGNELIKLWCIYNKDNIFFQHKIINYFEEFFKSRLKGESSKLVESFYKSYIKWLNELIEKKTEDGFKIFGAIIKNEDNIVGMMMGCNYMDDFEDNIIHLNK
jgi:hypothetical protein